MEGIILLLHFLGINQPPYVPLIPILLKALLKAIIGV